MGRALRKDPDGLAKDEGCSSAVVCNLRDWQLAVKGPFEQFLIVLGLPVDS